MESTLSAIREKLDEVVTSGKGFDKRLRDGDLKLQDHGRRIEIIEARPYGWKLVRNIGIVVGIIVVVVNLIAFLVRIDVERKIRDEYIERREAISPSEKEGNR